LIITSPHLEIFWSFANAEINRSWLQKRLSPCTKPASEAESLVPTHVKLSKWCQSDYARANRYYCWNCKRESPNNLLLQITNLSIAAKMLKKCPNQESPFSDPCNHLGIVPKCIFLTHVKSMVKVVAGKPVIMFMTQSRCFQS